MTWESLENDPAAAKSNSSAESISSPAAASSFQLVFIRVKRQRSGCRWRSGPDPRHRGSRASDSPRTSAPEPQRWRHRSWQRASRPGQQSPRAPPGWRPETKHRGTGGYRRVQGNMDPVLREPVRQLAIHPSGHNGLRYVRYLQCQQIAPKPWSPGAPGLKDHSDFVN